MLPAQEARLGHSAGMRDDLQFFLDAALVIGHADRFGWRIETALQAPVMRGDAGGAGVLVAAHRLYAPQGEHESPRGNAKSAPAHSAQATSVA